MIIQAIANIPEICAKKGIKHVILSPGSRCAALTIGFVRHPEIQCRTVSDERSAAFIALGIAQKTQQSTVLVCTSGSAAYNYAPAIAEAFFQNIPLLILTADRPKEWIAQQDGQTIFQENIFGKHVKESYALPSDFEHKDASWYSNRILNEALNQSMRFPKGPVHVNVPIREPFYPEKNEVLTYQEQRIIQESKVDSKVPDSDWDEMNYEFLTSEKVLIIAGQNSKEKTLDKTLDKFSKDFNIPIVGDILSNVHELTELIKNHDSFLPACEKEDKNKLKPQLLITFGKSVISKSIKLYLRKYRPLNHWHIQEAGEVVDIYQSLTKIIRCSPSYFFEKAISKLERKNIDSTFKNQWLSLEKKTKSTVKDFFENETNFSEFKSIQKTLEHIPENTDLHLANSMSVRYVNYLGVNDKKGIEIFSNRGVSGIDGCTSTAVGTALVSDRLNCLVTGDMAFFYDRNALWNTFNPPNLRIILINNHAGGIFRMIPDSSEQPELEEYFETEQLLYAKNTCKDFKLEYSFCDTIESLEESLADFFQSSKKPKLLEIKSDKILNKSVFNALKTKIKNIYATRARMETD